MNQRQEIITSRQNDTFEDEADVSGRHGGCPRCDDRVMMSADDSSIPTWKRSELEPSVLETHPRERFKNLNEADNGLAANSTHHAVSTLRSDTL